MSGFLLLISLWTMHAAAMEEKTIAFSSGVRLKVEVAVSSADRAKGLMHRTELPEGRGMLFVFPSDQYLSFWMKDTYIPLTIGFFSSDRKLLETKDMEPHTGPISEDKLPHYRSTVPSRYAIEVPRGWFEKNKIRSGAQFQFVKSSAPPRRE